MPAEIMWTNLGAKGTQPKPRSGHSLTFVDRSTYIMYGGIEEPKEIKADTKIVPNGDIYSMKLSQKECRWEKEKGQGDDLPPARAQHVAVATPKFDRIFIFGGHAAPTQRLNDCWWLKVSDFTWTRCLGEKSSSNNQESSIGAPSPRANSAACYYNGKIYVYGGHGGLSYQRVAHNDVHSFDIETETWTKHDPVVTQSPLPEGRGGHSLFAIDDKLYSYGGWNSETQYNNIIIFDLNTSEWSDPDIYNDVSRWNHSAIMVEAIPSWKYFIFGGESTNFNEGQSRTFGSYVNTACYLDLANFKWAEIKCENADHGPTPREYSSMSYDHSNSRLIVFGGWNNGWLNDCYALSVGKIVGPSYAITEIDPPLGQLTGGVPVTIKGQGFKDQSIKIYFTVGKTPTDVPGKFTLESTGVFVSETELTAITPNFESFGPKECVVQLSILGNELTTTSVPFSYFMNTRALKSLCFGPGLLKDQAVGEPVEFVIQARNEDCLNRKSGRDIFLITIKTDTGVEVPNQIADHDNGQYFVTYTVQQECSVNITVLFQDDKGKMVPLRGSPYSASFNSHAKADANHLNGPSLPKYVTKIIDETGRWMRETTTAAKTSDKDLSEIKTLIGVVDSVKQVQAQTDTIMLQLDQLEETLNFLQTKSLAKDSQIKQSKKLFEDWTNLKKLAKETHKEISPLVQSETQKNNNQISKLEEDLKVYTQDLKKRDFYKYECGRENALNKLEAVYGEINDLNVKITNFGYTADKFGNPQLIDNCNKQVEVIKGEVGSLKTLWDHINTCQKTFASYMTNTWEKTEPFEMEDEVKKLMKTLKDMKVDKRANAYLGILEDIKKWLVFLPLIAELRDPAMRDRHWNAIKTKVKSNFVVDNKLLLSDIYNLNLGDYKEDVEEITDQARQEAKMEKTLAKLAETWKDIKFEFSQHKQTDVQLIRISDENNDLLEENTNQASSMQSSRYIATFEAEVEKWVRSLANITDVLTKAAEVQRNWAYLENLFLYSDEVKKELPEQAKRFIHIDNEVKRILADASQKQYAITFCDQPWVLKGFDAVFKDLEVCEKALNKFMDEKKKCFPRFYFTSSTDLLDILSNGSTPAKVMKFMSKIFQAIENLELKESGSDRPVAVGMHTNVGIEYVEFTSPLKLLGKVENYMQEIINAMKLSLKEIAGASLIRLAKLGKDEWLKADPAQTTLLINMLNWTKDVEGGFNAIKGDKEAMKKCHLHQIKLLSDLITMVQGDLSKPQRQKLGCLITMDAHSRDIIEKLYIEKVYNSEEFQWQSQLKVYWMDDKKDFNLRIADAAFDYGYEYLGNGPRLVITPLTDRIYVTATQALHLCMGCAPAGPAGTGKTETTKDLSSALAKAIYVFNCSDQMDYKGMAGIFKGLAASGSWGCFDEFNRLVPEVLSVCSVQFKSVTDAIKGERSRFKIEGDEMDLDPTCGAFITMNPGYLGRSELPEGLKALFRPITVVVPDLELICENMLMSEGFVDAKILAKKFTTLYFLCRDLLSKASHYDWGLRAIKSVLVVAGSFKRQEPTQLELAILLRALRDFNTPKIVAEDWDIFFGLLGDLFPGIEVPRKRDARFEGMIQKAAEEQKLMPDENFIRKVVELGELLVIRHCVFTMGPPGAGKSSTWKILSKAQTLDGKKTTCVDLNPKVVSTNELYGVCDPKTRDWKDGLMSNKLRALSEEPDTNPKWIILDGDLDANWIESMNSVMDDNKILTLASNERIVLKPYMRLIFEIRNLKFATPATVSRAGILYISDASGYQWKAYSQSWIKNQKYDAERKKDLQTLFDKYIDESLKHIRKSFKYTVPACDIQLIMTICKLLESILSTSEVKGLEYIFVFACVWCLGGGFTEKDGINYRRSFSDWWKDKWKVIKFPAKGTVFDYYVDIEQNRLEEWIKLQTKDITDLIDTSKPIQNFTVPTPDTISAQFLMKKFIQVNLSPLLVGSAGCGKTQITKGLLNDMTQGSADYLQQIINFNYYTDSTLLQTQLESQLEKKAGKTYAPLGKFKLLQFIDDLNMPQSDPYETQNAISLLRQHKDYEHWFERGTKWALRDIKNTMYIASMNPTAGSFFVDPRLQRWFYILAIPFPEQSSLNTIFAAYLNKHFIKFKGTIQELVAPVIKCALQLHTEVEKCFRKTALNFHYEFNVRHLTNIFQGLLVAKVEAIKEPDQLIKLWLHESERIYGDRLVNNEDLVKYRALAADSCKKAFGKFNLNKYFALPTPEPLIFAYFVGGLEDKMYDQFPNMDLVAQRLRDALREYNELNAAMDLVLFDDAMKHVCKISRIVTASSGHALLVGVGGSGKQSLSRLASSICQFRTTTIMISSTYGLNELKVDLQNMYNRTGIKDEGLMFLFNEGQITNEKFLVSINDLLASGEINDLFNEEELEGIVNNIRGAVKSEGIVDNKDNCWKFFLDRVRKNLHMSLCFSPVGDAFRNRSRKFPALVNCTVIDWFHPWPEEALLSVAAKFLEEVEMPSPEVRKAIERFMPFSFKVVDQQAKLVMEQERRYIYTTPKSFLELIKLFKSMLVKKMAALVNAREKYESGVNKLNETSSMVAEIEAALKISSVEVERIQKAATEQATIVGAEKAIVDVEAAKANTESAACAVIAKAVGEEMAAVQNDLDQALPAVERAMKALDGLNVKDFQMLKALANPPADVQKTFTAVLNLLCTVNENVPVDKKGRLNAENPWKAALKLMASPKDFLDSLNQFKGAIDTDKVPKQNFNAIRPTLAEETFTKEIIMTKSSAAAGLCDWIINITCYYDIVVSVEPKKIKVAAAQAQLAEANAKKQGMEDLVAELTLKLSGLMEAYNAAMDAKNKAEAEAALSAKRLDSANRLVGALGSESERWNNSIVQLTQDIEVVIGDVLIASSFVSYVGPFNRKFRERIVKENFVAFFVKNQIPFSTTATPLSILTTDAQKALWNSQKLPSDSVSSENGAILVNSDRYSLIIDPQLQGITWIKEKEKNNGLEVTRLTPETMNQAIKILERCVEQGKSVLIENLENAIDASIAPIYARQIIKRGRTSIIKMGDKELTLDPKFNLFMHTKLSNPHYPPEIQAEATLINFTVTEIGLEDQLLTLVVKMERPDLAAKKEELIQQQNQFKITLKNLEDDLLQRLADATGDILENYDLIDNLEKSKALSTEINAKVEIAKVTEVAINDASEAYRPAASRGALVFFLMSELTRIHSFYKFSLDSFIIVIRRAIDIVAEKLNPKKVEKEVVEGEEAEAAEEGAEGEENAAGEAEMTPRTLTTRVNELILSITYQGFNYVRRGTFERHKLIIATMLCFRINIRKKLIDEKEVNALIKKEVAADAPHQPESLKFIMESSWGAVKGLETVKIFENLISSMESEALQWRKWYMDEKAESVELPRAFKDCSLFHRLLLLRALRPDRLTGALIQYVTEWLGQEYTEQPSFNVFELYKETKALTPTFFVLFPGVDPTPDVEKIGFANGKKIEDGTFTNISMGQGQEDNANAVLAKAAKEGHWVMFQNVHLMQSWMKKFERNFEIAIESGAHPEFRCFVSSEPPGLPDQEIIPESILQNSIKVANEAPTDLKSNLRRAFSKFDEKEFERAKSHKLSEYKALLFGLCMFHSLIVGRKKFGAQGWSRNYNFNDGDLTICGDVLHNYLTKYEKVPYADLAYIYGEIMYGGHITDNWDRRTNNSYLIVLIRPEILQQMQLTLAPGFKSPDPVKFDREAYRKYIEEKLPAEQPQMFGLHPNAEIGYLTTQSETLFSTILSVSGGSSSGGGGDSKIKGLIVQFLGQLPADFNMFDIFLKAKNKTPYVVVCLQECERMNILLQEIRTSLNDLDSGLKGALNITDAMELLGRQLNLNLVPGSWEKYAYFSKKNLIDWFSDMLQRVIQLVEWQEALETPAVVWISGLFNPMSYLTAIMQVTARANQLPLDDMCLITDILNTKEKSEFPTFAPIGAYINGFFLEGAAWEAGRGGEQGYLTEMQLKDLHPIVPVCHITAVRRQEMLKRNAKGVYECPVYTTSMRGPTYIFTAGLRMESEDTDCNKWILAGVALLMSPE